VYEGEEIFADKMGVHSMARDLSRDLSQQPAFVADFLFVNQPDFKMHLTPCEGQWGGRRTTGKKPATSHMKRGSKQVGRAAGVEKSGHYLLGLNPFGVAMT